MEAEFRDNFSNLWKKFFGESELPIAFYYTSEEGCAPLAKPGTIPRCAIAALSLVRNGESLAFDAESIACFGGKRFLGFSKTMTPNFEYFISCGIPGKLDGERYKKTPEIATAAFKDMTPFTAPAKFIVFKRWDKLDRSDKPDVVVFFAKPDVLSGLFTLANFDETEDGVISPAGSGCSSAIQKPYLEKKAVKQRAVIGLFDVSARPFVPYNTLTFAVPMQKFERMVNNMEESFLITNSWKAVQKRI